MASATSPVCPSSVFLDIVAMKQEVKAHLIREEMCANYQCRYFAHISTHQILTLNACKDIPTVAFGFVIC